MKKIFLMALSIFILIGCSLNEVPEESASEIPVAQDCNYTTLTGDEFVMGPLNDYDKNRYGYFHFYTEPNFNAPKLPYSVGLNHFGKLTNEITNSQYLTFRKAILDNCDIVYISVIKTEPYELSQIEKSGEYLVETEKRLTEIKISLSNYIDHEIYAKTLIGFQYLEREDGQKSLVNHGDPLLVKDVVVDLQYKSVYMIVKYGNEYLKLPYDSGYYLDKPTNSTLKDDLWNKQRLITVLFDFVKDKLSSPFTDQVKNIELASLYFPSWNDMFIYRIPQS